MLLTWQHLVEINGQQQVEPTVEHQHEQRDVQRVRAVPQRGEDCSVALSLQIHHLHRDTHNQSFLIYNLCVKLKFSLQRRALK